MLAEDAPYALGLSGIDPGSLASALAEASLDVASRPGELARTLAELALDNTWHNL